MRIFIRIYVRMAESLFQFILVTASDVREKEFLKQCHLFAPDIPVIIIKADDPPSYVPESESQMNKRIMYCTRSHFHAIAHAADDKSTPFSVIFEDDVAFHTTNFILALKEIIKRWNELVYPDKMASIGWIPGKNYPEYSTARSVGSLECMPGSKIINDRFTFGTQAYVVRKADLALYVSCLVQPTYEKYVDAMKLRKFPDIKNDAELLPCDIVLPRILGQRSVFPPVAIELQTPSLIGHNQNYYWDNYFKDHEHLRNEYYKPESKE
jgi:hypothetical protein